MHTLMWARRWLAQPSLRPSRSVWHVPLLSRSFQAHYTLSSTGFSFGQGKARKVYANFPTNKITDLPLNCNKDTLSITAGGGAVAQYRIDMPKLAVGTWMASGGEIERAVFEGIKIGYRHIDTATRYGNEGEVGRAIQKASSEENVCRDDLFVTTKLANTDHHPDDVLTACKKSLHLLGLEQVDLYLVHMPIAHSEEGDNLMIPLHETWQAMEGLVEAGLVKSIGVSNVCGALLHDLLCGAAIIPSVNQVERHPLLTQRQLAQYCHANDIAIAAYSPLGSPGMLTSGQLSKDPLPHLMKHDTVLSVASDNGRSPAQTLVRWSMQCGYATVVKSVHAERLKSNFDVFGWELSDNDMRRLNDMHNGTRFLGERHLDLGHGVPFYW